VKKAKRNQKQAMQDAATTDLADAEEEMESMKVAYEEKITQYKKQITDLTNEVKEWKTKATDAMHTINTLKEKVSVLSLSRQLPMSTNNENDSTAAAESFEQRRQRDQRFNKHKRLADLSPEQKKKSPTAREPLSPVRSPNCSIGDVDSNIILEKSIDVKSINKEGKRSPSPFVQSAGDGSPIAPPQQSNIAGANIFYSRTLRSHNLRTLKLC
jgi:vacuolar-type H+-ATPase subunit I/STV1